MNSHSQRPGRRLAARLTTGLKLLVGLIVLLELPVRAALGAIVLGAPFGDHMVLQQGIPITIWGTGCPGGDTVRISIAGQNAMTTSDWEGKWRVQLAPLKAGGPYQMLIEVGGYGPLIPSSAANSRGGAELNDVLVGEVVHAPAQASGAVNPAASTTPADPPSDGSHPYAWIRIYAAPPAPAGLRTPPASARWSTLSEAGQDSSRSAALAFARELYARLHVPIGLIDAPGVAPPDVSTEHLPRPPNRSPAPYGADPR